MGLRWFGWMAAGWEGACWGWRASVVTGSLWTVDAVAEKCVLGSPSRVMPVAAASACQSPDPREGVRRAVCFCSRSVLEPLQEVASESDA